MLPSGADSCSSSTRARDVGVDNSLEVTPKSISFAGESEGVNDAQMRRAGTSPFSVGERITKRFYGFKMALGWSLCKNASACARGGVGIVNSIKSSAISLFTTGNR